MRTLNDEATTTTTQQRATNALLCDTEGALLRALGLCDYLVAVWPEVGDLPSVQGTRGDVLRVLDKLRAVTLR